MGHLGLLSLYFVNYSIFLFLPFIPLSRVSINEILPLCFCLTIDFVFVAHYLFGKLRLVIIVFFIYNHMFGHFVQLAWRKTYVCVQPLTA